MIVSITFNRQSTTHKMKINKQVLVVCLEKVVYFLRSSPPKNPEIFDNTEIEVIAILLNI